MGMVPPQSSSFSAPARSPSSASTVAWMKARHGVIGEDQLGLGEDVAGVLAAAEERQHQGQPVGRLVVERIQFQGAPELADGLG